MIGVISCHTIFNEMAMSLSQRFGFQLITDVNPQSGDIYIILGGHEKAVELYTIQKTLKNSIGYIIYNSEQVCSDYWRNKYYLMLCRENVVFNYSTLLAKDLEKKFKIPTYSFFNWDFLMFQDIEPHEKYDIVFVGKKNINREELHQQLVSAFPEKKILFDYNGNYLAPNKLTSLLHSTDVLINFPYYEDNILATHRINKAISCGCKVVSIFSQDDDMNELYKDYVHLTNNIPKFLKKAYENGFESKKNWSDLTENMGKKLLPNNYQVIKHVEQKLKDKIENSAIETCSVYK